MNPTVLLSGLCIASIVVVAGCGGDQKTVTEERTVTATDTGTATDANDGVTPGGVAVVTPSKATPLHYFQTPSGNIGCYVDREHARCDIAQRSWRPPAPTTPCDLDYGQGLIVTSKGAAIVCAGDTTLGAPATLAYGSFAQRGPFRCDSERSGITCTDAATGHGFFISRESYRLL